ncbi:hypothetical protein BC937DRAFT_92191, partial [Endogone sp. FLAS-F59071]
KTKTKEWPEVPKTSVYIVVFNEPTLKLASSKMLSLPVASLDIATASSTATPSSPLLNSLENRILTRIATLSLGQNTKSRCAARRCLANGGKSSLKMHNLAL